MISVQNHVCIIHNLFDKNLIMSVVIVFFKEMQYKGRRIKKNCVFVRK